MGVFDYLRCHYPLPVEGANALEYQTKDTDAQYMENYEIRADGTLWHQRYDTEDQSDPNATGLDALIGCETRVNERWEQDTSTGEIVFYAYPGKVFTNENEVCFSAYFVDGLLKHLHCLSAGKAAA